MIELVKNFIFYQKINFKEDKNFIHESGHVISAFLFSEDYFIDHVTLNPSYAKRFNLNNEGGSYVVPRKGKIDSEQLLKEYIFILLSGYVSQELFTNRNLKHQSNSIWLSNFLSYNKALGCDGDFYLISKHYNKYFGSHDGRNHIIEDILIHVTKFFNTLIIENAVLSIVFRIKASIEFTIDGNTLENTKEFRTIDKLKPKLFNTLLRDF